MNVKGVDGRSSLSKKRKSKSMRSISSLTFFAIPNPNSPLATDSKNVSFDDAYTMRALIFDSGGHVKMNTSAHDADDDVEAEEAEGNVDEAEDGMAEEAGLDAFGGSVYRKNE